MIRTAATTALLACVMLAGMSSPDGGAAPNRMAPQDITDPPICKLMHWC